MSKVRADRRESHSELLFTNDYKECPAGFSIRNLASLLKSLSVLRGFSEPIHFHNPSLSGSSVVGDAVRCPDGTVPIKEEQNSLPDLSDSWLMTVTDWQRIHSNVEVDQRRSFPVQLTSKVINFF